MCAITILCFYDESIVNVHGFADLDQAKKMLADKLPGAEAVGQQDPFATQVIPRITPEMLAEHQSKAVQKTDYPQRQGSSYADTGYDEEEADEQPVYKSKKFMLGMVAILVVGFFVGSFMSFGKFWSSAELDVPDVVGRPAAVAQQMLEDNNLRVKIVEALELLVNMKTLRPGINFMFFTGCIII